MTSLPGNPPSEFRRLTPCPALSSLSPLAAPYTAGGRPIASDPIHNPASLGPTAPTMLHQLQQKMTGPAETFAFGSGSDVISAGGGEPPYYRQYEQWPSWAPAIGEGGSRSWIDPSENYHLPKGSAAAMSLNHYEQAQNLPTAPHTNPLPSTHRIIENASPWKGGQDSAFFSIFSKVPRSSGMGPALKEPSLDPFQNASRSSVADHRDLLLTSVLNDSSDSFSLDASSSKGYCGSTYDKYLPSREPTSRQSPTDQLSFGPGNGLVVGPTDRSVNCTSGFSSLQYGNPCRISMDYFECLPHEQKIPVTYSTSNCTKVKIAAPIAKSPSIKSDNLVVESCGLDIKSRSGNAKPGKSGTEFALESMVLEGLDEQNVGLDSPCWKGMPSSSQFIFSKTDAEKSCNFALENEIPTGKFFPSQTFQYKKLDPVAIGLVNSSEEKVEEQNKNQNFKPDNVQKNGSSDNNVKDEKSKRLASPSLAGVVDPPTDVKLLIQSLCGLSHTLLTSFGDEFELTEHELELLQMAMENLKSFTGGRNKTDNDRPASSVKITDQISAGTDNRTSTEANYNQSNVGPQLADSIYKKSFLEAIDKIPEEDSELRAELYKNLWIEAEASLCTMKYELQLARAKLKMRSLKHVHEANSSCSVSDPQPSSKMQNVGANTQTKQTLWDLNCGMPEEKDAGSVVDPAVMARLRIIKGCNTEPQAQSDGETSSDQNITMGHKDFSSSLSGMEKSIEKTISVHKDISSSFTGSGDEVAHDEVDSDVMARWRVLQRRGDVILNAESILPNYYSSGIAMESRDLRPHAGSSEWEHVLKDELSPSGNSTMNG